MPSSGTIDLFVIEASDIEETPEPDNTIEIKGDLFGGGKSCTINNPPPDTLYRAAIVAETMTRFTITAQSSQGIVKLQASVPVHGEVDPDKWQYYVINVANSTQDMMLQLTPYEGAADMYIIADQQPTKDDFDFMITHNRNETMYITHEDRVNINHPSGPYYIGIYGYHHALYALYVSLNETSIIPLVPGVFQNGYVEQNMTQYYSLEVPDTEVDYQITTAVTRSSGSPDLFIKLCTEAKESPVCRFSEDEIQNPEGKQNLWFQRSGYSDTQI